MTHNSLHPSRICATPPIKARRQPRLAEAFERCAVSRSGKKKPPALRALAHALGAQLAAGCGPLHRHLALAAPLAGYTGQARSADNRRRRWRSDGRAAAAGLLALLLARADLMTGAVQRGVRIEDVAQALGIQTRTAERAAFVLRMLGLLACEQAKTKTPDGFRSEPARWRVALGRLAELAGLGWLLKKDRNALSQRGRAGIEAGTSAGKAAGLAQALGIRSRRRDDSAALAQARAEMAAHQQRQQQEQRPPADPALVKARLAAILDMLR